MRERALVHVAGQSGAGKTTLIEGLLQSNRSKMLMVGRGVADDAVPEARESIAGNDDELNRYNEAGATCVVRYRFPPDVDGGDAFFCSEFMSDYSESVIVEGDLPPGVFPDLTVFVARPLPAGTPLLQRREVDRSAAHARELDQLQALLDEPDALASFLSKRFEAEFGQRGSVPDEVLGSMRTLAVAKLEEARRKGPPPVEQRWTLTEGYAGIEQAQVVVLNVRSPGDREQAQGMLTELSRLRKDRAVFNDIIGWRGKRLPITAAAADLADSRDRDLKRILARIKRAFTPRG